MSDEKKPEMVFGDEMVERVARVLSNWQGVAPDDLKGIAHEVLEAAFEGVPTVNYGIGLMLQFFDVVIGAKDRGLNSAGGVYVKIEGQEDAFDSLGHHIEFGWNKSGKMNRIAVSKIAYK